MAFMGSGESGRAAAGLKRETNAFKQGRSGGRSPQMDGPVKSVKHNKTQSGGINRPTRGTGAGAKNY